MCSEQSSIYNLVFHTWYDFVEKIFRRDLISASLPIIFYYSISKLFIVIILVSMGHVLSLMTSQQHSDKLYFYVCKNKVNALEIFSETIIWLFLKTLWNHCGPYIYSNISLSEFVYVSSLVIQLPTTWKYS